MSDLSTIDEIKYGFTDVRHQLNEIEDKCNWTQFTCFVTLLLLMFVAGATCNKANAGEPHLWHATPKVQLNLTWNPLGDVIAHSHGPVQQYGDRGTTAHEGLHGVNSDYRQALPGKACFYLLHDDVAVLAKTSRVTLAQVAALIRPRAEDQYDYNVYLVNERRWWNNEPLYILDEFSAYLTGAQERLMDGTYSNNDRRQLEEFSYFSDALVKAVEYYEPQYADMQELRDVVDYMKRYAQNVIQTADSRH